MDREKKTNDKGSDWRNYAMKCFGKEYYAYRDLTRRNQRLSNALRNLRAVNFSIIARQVVLTTAEARMNPVELVTDFPKWHLMDNAQLMVNALNASPSVRRVNICCTFQDKGFGPHSRYGANHSMHDIFEAFEQLRPDIELRICVHVVVVSLRTEIQLPNSRGFPSQDDMAYISRLQTRRVGQQDSRWLIDEWILLRSILSNMLYNLPSHVGDHNDNLGRRVNRLFDLADEAIHPVFSKAIVKTYQAHRRGDRVSFTAGQGQWIPSPRFARSAIRKL